MNWRGQPLTSHDVIVRSIAEATTRTGLTVHAELDTDTAAGDLHAAPSRLIPLLRYSS